jgi:hypothetical protein
MIRLNKIMDSYEYILELHPKSRRLQDIVSDQDKTKVLEQVEIIEKDLKLLEKFDLKKHVLLIM